MHYQRWRNAGLDATVPKTRPVVERFLEKVDKRGPDECWEWTAFRDKNGYGTIADGPAGGQIHHRAHRFSYAHYVGPIPEGLFVLHRCDNPPCVNPAHLFVGTPSDNTQDAMAKGRWNPPRGTRNSRAVLTEDQVRASRALYVPRKFSFRRIARVLGVSEYATKEVIQGNNWRWLD